MTKVLLIEDEPDSLQLLSEVFTAQGADVRGAENGADALRLLSTFHPAIAVIDLQLPDIDGWTVLRRARAIDPGLVCVAVTAHHSLEIAARARKAGFDAFFAKPLDSLNLLGMISDLVHP